LLVATFALQSLTSVDRYVMQHLAGREVLGAYVLFAGLSAAMASILDAGVFSFAYPRMIDAHHKGQKERFQRELRRMVGSAFVACVGVSVVLWIAIDPLLAWVGKAVFVAHKDMLPWVLLATSLNSVSYAPHYALYAQGRDRAIIVANLLGLCVFAALILVLRLRWPTLAVPMALCGAFGTILFAKTWAYLRTEALTRSAPNAPPSVP
jgi:O-antigen/teichoic acid export membrane protein